MKNDFFQVALVSFAGIIILIAALAFLGSGSLLNNNMSMMAMNGQNMSQMNMNGMSMPQNMPMGNGANMMGGMYQNTSAYYGDYGHMRNSYPGSMDAVSYSNMGNMSGQMNMPMGNAGMNSAQAPIVIVVPGQNQQYSTGMNGNGMNGMNQMNGMDNGKMMMMGM